MSDEFKLPEKKSVIFWPVGTGDSATLVLRPNEVVMQVDLHNMERADDDDDPAWHIVDHLVRILPKKNGRPYLAAFVLTHPDKDHVKGFAELLGAVDIGELWHTPKIFRDHANQEAMCDDAKAFRKEADRRRLEILKDPENVKSGNRLRVIGHDDILFEPKYKDIPGNCKSKPSEIVRVIDGADLDGELEIFIHAPFKHDQAQNKNNTSLSFNLVLFQGSKYGQFFFFGDREYPTIKRIFERTEETAQDGASGTGNTPYLHWDVMLCSHHCSKAVMHWQEEGDDKTVFKRDIMDIFEKYNRAGDGYIVASADADFTDNKGDNPPHQLARDCYGQILKAGHFICTHEYPSQNKPWPLVFSVGDNGFEFDDKRTKSQGPAALAAAVTAARGAQAPPAQQTTFG